MDSAEARALLAGERARIEHALDALARGEREGAGVAREVGDAEDLVGVELAQAQAERLRDELAAVERAEARVADGTYGVSVESGQPIADARLRAVPWAERTAEEQARYES